MESCHQIDKKTTNETFVEQKLFRVQNKRHLPENFHTLSNNLCNPKKKPCKLKLTITIPEPEQDLWGVDDGKIIRCWKVNIEDPRELFYSPRELKKGRHPKGFGKFIENFYNNF